MRIRPVRSCALASLVAAAVLVVLAAGAGCRRPKPTRLDAEQVLKAIPANAALVIALASPRKMIEKLGVLLDERSTRELLEDLEGTFAGRTGLRVDQVRLLTVFGTMAGKGAFLIHGVEGNLTQGKKVGDHHGVALLELGAASQLLAAHAEDLLFLGDREAIQDALDANAGRKPGLARQKTPFADAVKRQAGEGTFLAILETSSLAREEPFSALAPYGVRSIAISATARSVRASATGPAEGIGRLAKAIEEQLAALDAQTQEERKKAVAGGGLLDAAQTIATAHHVSYLARTLEPRVDGERVVVELPLAHEGDAVIQPAIVAVIGAVAVPTFLKYVKRAKTTEAVANVRRLFEGARDAAAEVAQGATPRFPVGKVGPTPTLGACCKAGGRCKPDPLLWKDPLWSQLRFDMTAPHHFSYVYTSDGATFTAAAHGDLDCDGLYSTFEMVGSIAPDGTVIGDAGFYKDRELE